MIEFMRLIIGKVGTRERGGLEVGKTLCDKKGTTKYAKEKQHNTKQPIGGAEKSKILNS